MRPETTPDAFASLSVTGWVLSALATTSLSFDDTVTVDFGSVLIEPYWALGANHAVRLSTLKVVVA